MNDQKPVGRFAPTPSGRMHLGNVFAALIAWVSVRSRDGSLVLRMEDLDTQRTSEENAKILFEKMKAVVPDAECNLLFGGQPLYDFVISVE